MKDDNEQIQVQFHSKANPVFFSQLTSFDQAVKDLDRQLEEYRFQQIKDAHIHSLKQELETCALQLLQQHTANEKGRELSQNLQHHIQQYLHLFVQKTRGL